MCKGTEIPVALDWSVDVCSPMDTSSPSSGIRRSESRCLGHALRPLPLFLPDPIRNKAQLIRTHHPSVENKFFFSNRTSPGYGKPDESNTE